MEDLPAAVRGEITTNLKAIPVKQNLYKYNTTNTPTSNQTLITVLVTMAGASKKQKTHFCCNILLSKINFFLPIYVG